MQDEANVARVRIGKVRFKNGATVHVLPEPENTTPRYVLREIQEAITAHGEDIAGFFFIAWASDTGSTAAWDVWGGIPRAVVPRFIEERARAEIIEKWTREGLRENPI